jgi:hypothetical protein
LAANIIKCYVRKRTRSYNNGLSTSKTEQLNPEKDCIIAVPQRIRDYRLYLQKYQSTLTDILI